MRPFAAAIKRFQQSRRPPTLPIVVLTAVVLTAVFAPMLSSQPPLEGNLAEGMLPPSWVEGGHPGHLLGTDRFGRDILSRLLYGGRISLSMGLVAIAFAGTLGSAVGLVSGYFGGWVDTILMRIVDLTFSLPLILIAFVLAITVGPSFWNIILVLAALLWARYARQVRAEVLSVKGREFVALAQVAGCSHVRIMVLHILPNVFNTIVVLATLQVGYVILLEASLSFLGVGIPPPEPAWGVMVADGRGYIMTAWWISLFPGLAILLTCLALNMLGDWLRDILDPHLRHV